MSKAILIIAGMAVAATAKSQTGNKVPITPDGKPVQDTMSKAGQARCPL